MPQHISAPKLLSCCVDCCLALHFFYASIESLWSDCSSLQVGRQYEHSICTLQLSTTTHSAAHNDPPPPARTANCTSRSCRKFAESFAEKIPEIILLRQRRLRKCCGNFVEIRRNVRKLFRRKLVQQMLCRMRAAVRTHFPPTLRVRMVLDLSDRADLYLGFSLQETLQ